MTTHAELVRVAVEWLRRRRRFAVTLGDVRCTSVAEQPDAIGWDASGRSVLVECKVSRGDYLRDARKPHRRTPERGMGDERYLLAPPGVTDNAPPGWGHLVYDGTRVRLAYKSDTFLSAKDAEMRLILHAVRRALNGVNDAAYHVRRFARVLALTKGAA